MRPCFASLALTFSQHNVARVQVLLVLSLISTQQADRLQERGGVEAQGRRWRGRRQRWGAGAARCCRIGRPVPALAPPAGAGRGGVGRGGGHMQGEDCVPAAGAQAAPSPSRRMLSER